MMHSNEENKRTQIKLECMNQQFQATAEKNQANYQLENHGDTHMQVLPGR